MVVQKVVRFTFPKKLLKQPMIYSLIRKFDLLTNIVQANVTQEEGWMILDIRGESTTVQQALAWMAEQGVQVHTLSAEEEAACRS